MRKKLTPAAVLLFLGLAFLPADGAGLRSHKSKDAAQDKDKTVYVCACLGSKSCSCMTEAKMEGPCACGTQGGPPLKAVRSDSDWAKENRDALAK